MSAIPKSPLNRPYGTDTLANLDQLDLSLVRVWVKFDDAYDVVTHTPRYTALDLYLDTYHRRADTLLVNWQSSYDPLVTGGSFTESGLLEAERDMLAYYKQRYPKIELIEAENEPTGLETSAGAAAYYQKYRFIYRVVNAVNALGLPGPPLRVGGPTVDIFTTLRIGAFLDRYRADTDPAKRLDFISYHQYLVNTDNSRPWDADKANPAKIGTERAQLDALLAARGLPSLPAMVTETGIFPGSRETPLGIEADWQIQAAALASMHYQYLGQSNVVPAHWTIDHPTNDRKDMFVDPTGGVPRPYYNMMQMQSMLPRTRYQATSDTLGPTGTGVYGLAAANANEIAVMTWNYQWTGQASYDSRIVFSNFPAAFRNSNVLVERYRIDSSVDSGSLTPVHRFVIGPRSNGSYTGQTLPLGPNEIRLTVLTPTTAPIG